MGLIDPRYCCCAVPLVNAGIYAIMIEQIAVAMATGVLCFAAPAVVGASPSPMWLSYLLGVICFVGVLVQPVGFFGVFREKTTTFKWYITLNAVVTYVALAVAAVIVIISGVKHNTAVSNCKATYYAPPDEIRTMSGPLEILSDQSDPICMGFCWADLGMMAGLWAICFVMQSYYVWASSKYSRSQVSDHKLYHSVYSENPEAFTMSILQSRRYNPDSVYFQNPSTPGGLHPNDAWDHRPSYDGAPAGTPPHPNHPNQQGGQYHDQPYEGYSDQHPNQFNDRYTDDITPGPPQQYAFTKPHAGYVDHSNRV